ncbi:hypothetical protein Tco_0008161 [Tanacetum coccineum]
MRNTSLLPRLEWKQTETQSRLNLVTFRSNMNPLGCSITTTTTEGPASIPDAHWVSPQLSTLSLKATPALVRYLTAITKEVRPELTKPSEQIYKQKITEIKGYDTRFDDQIAVGHAITSIFQFKLSKPWAMWESVTTILPDVTYAINSSATPTGALSYQPRECTRVQNDSGPSGSSSSKRPRVCNDGQRRNPSDPPNHHTPAVTTSGTPSDTSGGRLDSTGTPSDTSGGRLDSTGAFSYQPRKRTRGSIFIQNDSGQSGISSSRRPRVCNDGRSRKPSGPPNYPTPAATTSGTPSDTATGHVDSTERIKDGFRSARPKYHHCCMAGGCPYDATQSFDNALAIKLCELFTYAHTEMTSEGVKQGLDRPFSGFKHSGLSSLIMQIGYVLWIPLVASLLLPAACHCQTETCPKKEKKKKALAQENQCGDQLLRRPFLKERTGVDSSYRDRLHYRFSYVSIMEIPPSESGFKTTLYGLF